MVLEGVVRSWKKRAAIVASVGTSGGGEGENAGGGGRSSILGRLHKLT